MGRKLRFKKIHETQATLGIELHDGWAINRVVSLSDQVNVLVARERIEIHGLCRVVAGEARRRRTSDVGPRHNLLVPWATSDPALARAHQVRALH